MGKPRHNIWAIRDKKTKRLKMVMFGFERHIRAAWHNDGHDKYERLGIEVVILSRHKTRKEALFEIETLQGQFPHIKCYAWSNKR